MCHGIWILLPWVQPRHLREDHQESKIALYPAAQGKDASANVIQGVSGSEDLRIFEVWMFLQDPYHYPLII